MPEPTTRRQFLARAAILAASAPTLGAFLQACSKSGAVVFGTEPDDRRAEQPGQVADRRRQQADRRRPRAGEGRDAQDLQLRRLSQPRSRQGLRGQVRDEDRDLDLQRRRRGDHQTPQRSRLRHLQRQLHRDQPPGEWRAGPAAEPLLHSRHQERVAELHQPLVRPGLAVHRAVHHLHHRNRLADRSGARRYRRDEESVRRRSGIRRTRARSPCWTTSTPRWPWCFCAKALRTSTRRRRPT